MNAKQIVAALLDEADSEILAGKKAKLAELCREYDENDAKDNGNPGIFNQQYVLRKRMDRLRADIDRWEKLYAAVNDSTEGQ